MTLKLFLHIILSFPLWQVVFGQQSNLIAGQFIIQVADNRVIDNFRQQIIQPRLVGSNQIQLQQIMKEPFSLWLFQCNDDAATVAYWKEALASNRDFVGVYPNRTLEQRAWPDDPDLGKQWQYLNPGGNGGVEDADIDMDLAWNITTGGLTPSGDTIVLCIIDDGINGNHEDMRQNLWINHGEIPSNGLDDDGNGYVDDVRGWNVSSDSDDVYSGGGHGTPVAGVAGARGNNGVGVSGVNWNVKLMIVNYGTPTEANALASYGYAYTMRKMYNHSGGKKGAYVVATNASWGIDKATADEAPLWCALYDSLGRVGIVSCGATTNSDTDVDAEGDLPTSCESDFLISVTNMNRSNTKVVNAGFGNKSIDLGSYGQQIYTVTRTGYGTFGGTSGATPHVTGVIGLMYSLPCQKFDSLSHSNPALAARAIRDALLNGVKPNTTLQQITTSGGVLNAFNALKTLQTLCDSCALPVGVSLEKRDLSLVIHWPFDSQVQVAVRYRVAGEVRWIVQEDVVSGIEIKDLLNCTEYEVQMGARCGMGQYNFQYSRFVKTTGCCAVPVTLSLEADSSAVSLTFEDQPDASVTISYSLDQKNWQDTLVAGNSLVLSNVDLCKSVYFRLQAQCSTYNNTSGMSDVSSISTPCGNCTNLPYCLFSKKDDTQEWIKSFSIGGTTIESGSSGQGYSNQAGAGHIELVPGNSYPFSVLVGYAATPFPDFFKLYADLDQNGTFSTGERLYQTPAPITESINGSITIPEGIQEGYTRCRLILSYELFEGACDSDTFEYGEVEDHCVYFSGRTCPFSANVKWLDADKSSLRFVIAKKENVPDTILVRYRVKGESAWKEVMGADSVRLSGLEECTLYEVAFRSFCGNVMSLPTQVDTFRTACINQLTESDNSIKIWPNPATDKIYFSGIKEIDFMQKGIYDALGRKIMSGEERMQISGNSLDISYLLPGAYQLVFTSLRGEIKRFPFMVVR